MRALLALAAITSLSASALAADLPTPSLTPGVTRPGVTAEDLCPVAHTPALRNVTSALKRQVYQSYGMPGGDHTGYCRGKQGCEVDHLCSLELGGTNDAANLWPQSYDTSPWNAHVKDRLENNLHKRMCAGELTPQQACAALSGDWTASFRKYIGDP